MILIDEDPDSSWCHCSLAFALTAESVRAVDCVSLMYFLLRIAWECDSADGKEKIEFWNASKGLRYSQNDPHCSLKEIFYIISDKNIWGNIQTTQDLRHTKFDLL